MVAQHDRKMYAMALELTWLGLLGWATIGSGHLVVADGRHPDVGGIVAVGTGAAAELAGVVETLVVASK